MAVEILPASSGEWFQKNVKKLFYEDACLPDHEPFYWLFDEIRKVVLLR
jgi:hypothetical protein